MVAPAAQGTRVVRGREFRPRRAWDAVELMQLDGVSARLHWANKPCPWRVNEADEVFLVIDGLVDMHYRREGSERFVTLGAGDLFVAGAGCERIARPRGEARVLVVERAAGGQSGCRSSREAGC
ncbi:MAG TPA: cupin [Burkholderiaceae bacterium]|nr:cupin [Burkholderiaceae bacterium]